ncbi:MAG: hypothetical protein INR69_01255 [Mucilaginibacter polytrichastri]|nr:hypothetical protein [Mucilaginibacter polytrichastri]
MNLRHTIYLLFIPVCLTAGTALAQNRKKPADKKKPATEKTPVKKAPEKATDKPAPQTEQKTTKTDTSGGSISDEIVVVSQYKPSLADAVKIRRNPDLEDRIPVKSQQNYAVGDRRLEPSTDARMLQSQPYKPGVEPTPFRNYAKAGAGSLATTFGEVYVNNIPDQALDFGGYFKHMAQQGELTKQNTSNQEVGVFGRYIFPELSLNGRASYKGATNYFYGFDPLNPPEQFSPAKQRFNTFTLDGELTKNYQDVERDFIYGAKLNIYNFSNLFDNNETSGAITAYANAVVNEFYAGANASLDFTNSKTGLTNYANHIFRANPYLKFQGETYKVDAGARLAMQFGSDTKLRIFPTARAEFQVVPKYVRIFGEVNGDINKSTLQNFYGENPFLGNNLLVQNSVERLSISAGAKGLLAPGVGFKAYVFRKKVNDLPLIVNNFTEGNAFNVIYDFGNSRISGFVGEIDAKISENVILNGKTEYNNYKLATQQEAWNLPNFKLSANARIQAAEKIAITGTLLYRGEMFDRQADGTPVTLDGFADLSAGAEYRVNPRIGIFMQVNNLFGNKYYRYLNYAAYGLNVFGGVTVGF